MPLSDKEAREEDVEDVAEVVVEVEEQAGEVAEAIGRAVVRTLREELWVEQSSHDGSKEDYKMHVEGLLYSLGCVSLLTA